MAGQGELRAYRLIMKEIRIENYAEEEPSVNVIKYAELKPLDKTQMLYLNDFFLKEPAAESFYYVTLNSDYDSNKKSSFGHLKIARLAGESDIRKIRKGHKLIIPKKMIDGLLSYEWAIVKRTGSKGDYNEVSAKISIDREDCLFAEIAKFVR